MINEDELMVALELGARLELATAELAAIELSGIGVACEELLIISLLTVADDAGSVLEVIAEELVVFTVLLLEIAS